MGFICARSIGNALNGHVLACQQLKTIKWSNGKYSRRAKTMRALERAFERRSSEQTFTLRDPALKNLWGGYQSVAGANITPENSLRVSGWYAGVQIIAGAVASLPLITYERL